MAGRTVELPEQVERIGTLGAVGVLNALVEVMGAGPLIVNRMPGNFARGDRWKMQYQFAPQIAHGPLFESDSRELLVEDLLRARPDVSARYLKYFNDKLAEAETLTASLAPERRPTVLYGNPLQFSQPHQIAEWWIERAGGRSVTAGSPVRSGLRYGLEDLLAWNPEVMILMNPKDAEEMTRTEGFEELKAVKNRAFHYIPTVAHTWGNRTVEQPLTVLWAMSKLHPDLMPRSRLAEEIRYFYRTFVLYELSDEQLAAIIDGPSSGGTAP